MKRIIFSIYTDNVDEHSSVPDFKKEQFAKYKNQLVDNQKAYANICGADYELFGSNETNYDKIQFNKLLKIEELGQYYDEVLYIDFDIIPRTKVSFFEKFDLNVICAYSILSTQDEYDMRFRLKHNLFHSMDMFSKTCAKKAMLLLSDISGNNECINTGVVGMNRSCINTLAFSDRLDHCKKRFNEAQTDNLYPDDITKVWFLNNEVCLSYLIENYNLPFTNINLPWNFILDHQFNTPTAAAHLLHIVNKDFGIILQ